MLSFRVKALLLLAGVAVPAVAVAQDSASSSSVLGQAHVEDAGTALSRHLRTLSDEPQSVSALMGAGSAALELGDPQAALTFFARAEEVAPTNGLIKARMGSALVQMEKPATALGFFAEAARLGIPASEYAKDRGLAHDMTGDPKRAQADYGLALRRGADPETTRRLALSLAISGDRPGALAALADQIRRQDRAAWRTRAFVLALSGDAAEASRAAEAVMSAEQAGAMRPFFARLASLRPAEKAMAVHFGHFPNDGRTASPDRYAANSPTPNNRYLANPATPPPATQPSASAAATRQPATSPPTTTRSRRSRQAPTPLLTPGRRELPAVAQAEAPSASPEQRPAEVAARSVEAGPPPIRTLTARPAPSQPAILYSPPPRASAPPAAEPIRTTELPASKPAAADPKPVEVATADPATSTPRILQAPPPAPASTVTAAPGFSIAGPAPAQPSRLAGIADLVATLPDPEASSAASPPAREAATPPAAKPIPAKPSPARTAPAKKAAPPPPKEPSRHWVQIAGGADKGAMMREFNRLKGKAPKLLGARTPWTTPLRATNRLLVGPFKSSNEAQDFVNQLAKEEMSSFAWTSPAGQEIEKLAAK